MFDGQNGIDEKQRIILNKSKQLLSQSKVYDKHDNEINGDQGDGGQISTFNSVTASKVDKIRQAQLKLQGKGQPSQGTCADHKHGTYNPSSKIDQLSMDVDMMKENYSKIKQNNLYLPRQTPEQISETATPASTVLEILRRKQQEAYIEQQKRYGGIGTQMKNGPVFKRKS